MIVTSTARFRLVLDLEACRDDIRAVGGWEPTERVETFRCETCKGEFTDSLPHIHGRVTIYRVTIYRVTTDMEAYCSEGCAVKAMMEVEA